MATTELLKDHDPIAWGELPAEYRATLQERAAAFAAFIGNMPEDAVVSAWVKRMETKYGPLVRVWFNVCDWQTALMIVRWGEAVDKWPETFTDADRARTVEIERTLESGTGRWPEGLKLLEARR